MLVGSMANSLASGGGFCAGARVAVDHQRINGTSFVFSASMPALLATASSQAIQILTSTPSILTSLHANIFAIRSVLDKLDCITIPSHPASAVIHIHVRSPSSSSYLTVTGGGARRPSNPMSLAVRDPEVVDVAAEEKLLQEVVDEALQQGVLLTRAIRLRGQEVLEPRPSIKICASAALTKKETEKAVAVVKAALLKVLGRKR